MPPFQITHLLLEFLLQQIHYEIAQMSFDSFSNENQILLEAVTLTFRKVENDHHLAYFLN